jgi:hypothetical protein
MQNIANAHFIDTRGATRSVQQWSELFSQFAFGAASPAVIGR